MLWDLYNALKSKRGFSCLGKQKSVIIRACVKLKEITASENSLTPKGKLSPN